MAYFDKKKKSGEGRPSRWIENLDHCGKNTDSEHRADALPNELLRHSRGVEYVNM